MSGPMRLSSFGCLACLTLLLGSNSAAAEVSSSQRATAEALFQQAAQLMDQKRFSEACEKFAASQELDSGLGTMLYLADCYEQAGRTASAWALFREAEDAARPILGYNVANTCWTPQLKGLVLQTNSIYNGWRFEDVWLDR